ncbi:hypothetical protein GCM10017779_61820 [Streptomyces capillispiralis]|nr:hypothetical protein GCM10017779_61820 [Streptomyces capillispiralis]
MRLAGRGDDRSASTWAEVSQATTRRENPSPTADSYKVPLGRDHGESVVHSRFGLSAVTPAAMIATAPT